MSNQTIRALSRREFLGTVGLAGAALGMGLPHSTQGAQTGKIPIGLELYSLREQ